MPLLQILEFPDPRLRTVAAPVAEVNNEIRQLISDMFETIDLYEVKKIEQQNRTVIRVRLKKSTSKKAARKAVRKPTLPKD